MDKSKDYKFIDLGLPSGTLWADRNVGASSPSDYGGYYAWGETEIKEYYGLDNYKYGAADTTFVNIGSDIAGTRYDVACQKWGGSWKMPTKSQWQELIDNCTWTWTTQGGHSGYKVTGPNGNSIFLPAAGCRYGSSTYDVGSYGDYWSSTLGESNASLAWYLDFGSGSHYVYYYNRYYGHTVRPVTEKTNKDKDAIISLTSEEKGMRIVPQNNYELKIDNGEVFVVEKQSQYPKVYEECCIVLGYEPDEDEISCYKGHLIETFVKLLICRDAYWKIAGEQKGLEKPWEPDWESWEDKFCITIFQNKTYIDESQYINSIFAFPTEEMRDEFYKNFKDIIEECKELL